MVMAGCLYHSNWASSVVEVLCHPTFSGYLRNWSIVLSQEQGQHASEDKKEGLRKELSSIETRKP
jgi:hypothetical protein